MCCYALLQGIFPTQELNPGLLHCRQTLYRLSYKGTAAEQIEQAKAKVAVSGEKAWNARLLLRYEEVQTEVTHQLFLYHYKLTGRRQ